VVAGKAGPYAKSGAKHSSGAKAAAAERTRRRVRVRRCRYLKAMSANSLRCDLITTRSAKVRVVIQITPPMPPGEDSVSVRQGLTGGSHRKHTSFAVLRCILALYTMFWIKSRVRSNRRRRMSTHCRTGDLRRHAELDLPFRYGTHLITHGPHRTRFVDSRRMEEGIMCGDEGIPLYRSAQR